MINKKVLRVALVTGAARGIGLAIAKSLMRDGFFVVATDKDSTALSSAEQEINQSEVFATEACDVSRQDEVIKLFARVEDRFGSLGVLVNNAGIQTHEVVENMTENMWNETIDVNLKSVFLCTRSAIPIMKKLQWGRIISIASMSAVRGSYRHAHYCASKAGIVGFTKAVALEVGEFNITANTVCPGTIETRMIEETMRIKREKWLEEIPLKRFGKPEYIADIVSFLASDKASWITGQSIHVNGGIVTP
ncbi:SDR family NAD(P)-dependent oxidoreductase [Mesotoga prima]|uniref:SDR family NAD(P)-dependent oxidoreductase n=1 Tax=Mesotoga prima TaxID=1184387 RepID=UPI002BAF7C22|nr:SDR family NAD(P)-dependent oxidoreductase [Mesotoga prima]HQC15945.1 SDR family NAD(P)-dependent oxidoreductase [Mesotoga prima]